MAEGSRAPRERVELGPGSSAAARFSSSVARGSRAPLIRDAQIASMVLDVASKTGCMCVAELVADDIILEAGRASGRAVEPEQKYLPVGEARRETLSPTLHTEPNWTASILVMAVTGGSRVPRELSEGVSGD